jgi:tRNA-splicing endonuclease subunit Sen15, fungi type
MTKFHHELRKAVAENLKHQHRWTEVDMASSETGNETGNETETEDHHQLIRGLPPHRVYTHPDEQVEALELQRLTGQRPQLAPEYEWVLALHVDESISVRVLASIFDTIPVGEQEAHPQRAKHILVAVVHSDSTIVYYVMHDGLVKPRQN